MADPLSMAASVAGLTTVALTILTMANDLCSTVQNAPDSIRRIIDEMRQMHCIFLQVEGLISGTSTTPSNTRLSMISVHDLQATLSGCVLLCDRLNRKLCGVFGLQSPDSLSTPSGVFSAHGRVKWALWKESEALSILDDLQRHKASLNLMLNILQCTTIAATAESVRDCSQSVAELRLLVAELMTITHQVLVDSKRQTVPLQLQELLMRPQGVTTDQDGQRIHLLAAPGVHMTTASSDSGPTFGASPSSSSLAASSTEATGVVDVSEDNRSIRTTISLRGITSMTVSHFTEALTNSRPYKRLQRARGQSRKLSVGDTESRFSIHTGISRLDRWSTLSGLTLDDLPISQISVLELPLFMSDMWDSGPYEFKRPPITADNWNNLEPLGRPRKQYAILSSQGCIHKAIESNDEFTVRTLLTSGTEVNELDSQGWTPLFHAASLHQESICQLLLDNGAGLLPQPLVSQYSFKYIPSAQDVVREAVDTYFLFSSNNVVTLHVLLLQAVIETEDERSLIQSSHDGPCFCEQVLADAEFEEFLTHVRMAHWKRCETDPRPRGRVNLNSYLHNAIANQFCDKAIELLVLMGADIEGTDNEGRTPLYNAACGLREGVCRLLLKMGCNTQPIRGTAPIVDAMAVLKTRTHAYRQPLQTVPQLLTTINARMKGISLHSGIKTGREDIVLNLIDLGADIEEVDELGQTPLYHAFCRLQIDACRKLLEAGASTEALQDRTASATPVFWRRVSRDKFH